MEKKKITDEEITSGIFQEIELTMKRIEESHKNESLKKVLKRDTYSQMKDKGLWDARAIANEYVLISKKQSAYSAGLRQYIVVIFETASTNFWAKQAKKELDAKGNKKRGKK